MMEMLASGALDAVFTPFMPSGFFGRGSGFRQLLRDFRAAECAFTTMSAMCPPITFVGVKADVLREHPWVGDELTPADPRKPGDVDLQAAQICGDLALGAGGTHPCCQGLGLRLEQQRG